MTKLDVGMPDMDVGMMDLGDWLCRYAYQTGFKTLSTRQRKAAGGYLFSSGPRVVGLLVRVMEQEQYADLFARVPFTSAELRRRQGRVADLRSLRLALMFLLERVNDTRLDEESELNRLALMVLKSAEQQAADPFADEAHLLRLSAALAHVQQAVSRARGRRRRTRQRVVYRYGSYRTPGRYRASDGMARTPERTQSARRPGQDPNPRPTGSNDAGGGEARFADLAGRNDHPEDGPPLDPGSRTDALRAGAEAESEGASGREVRASAGVRGQRCVVPV